MYVFLFLNFRFSDTRAILFKREEKNNYFYNHDTSNPTIVELFNANKMDGLVNKTLETKIKWAVLTSIISVFAQKKAMKWVIDYLSR